MRGDADLQQRPLEVENNWPLEGALSLALPALLLQLSCRARRAPLDLALVG